MTGAREVMASGLRTDSALNDFDTFRNYSDTASNK